MVSLQTELNSLRVKIPHFTDKLLAAVGGNTGGIALAELTPAEQVVVACLLQGMSNKEIALALGKSAYTVKNQVSSCLTKLGVSTRSRLIAQLRLGPV